ncbi:MAG: AAA family ATPase [Ignavibacteria bacterium]|nr:AAA family ATPase [Ignavibacteria bacterium]
MKKLYFSIGISGTGKSTYYKNQFLIDFPEVANFLKERGMTLESIKVCPDDIRREVCGDVSDISRDNYVWELADSRMKKNLDVYGYCVFDSTGVSASGRKFLKKYTDVQKVAIVFEPNIELSKERILKDISEGVDRSKVPMFVVDRQFESFKNNVVGDTNWNKIYDDEAKRKIIFHLGSEFSEVKFV